MTGFKYLKFKFVEFEFSMAQLFKFFIFYRLVIFGSCMERAEREVEAGIVAGTAVTTAVAVSNVGTVVVVVEVEK